MNQRDVKALLGFPPFSRVGEQQCHRKDTVTLMQLLFSLPSAPSMLWGAEGASLMC